MGFFTSPIKLVEVLLRRNQINTEIEEGGDWCLSEDGRRQYEKCGSVAEKTEFIYKYLYDEDDNSNAREIKQKISYIIASTMAGSDKPYGKWPGIIDYNVNPLIDFALEGNFLSFIDLCDISNKKGYDITELQSSYSSMLVAEALAALHGTDSEDYSMTNPDAYKNLTAYNTDPEMFLIERSIIFNLGEVVYCEEEGIGPYTFVDTEF